MSPEDFHLSDISFYWQPNNTDPNRTVILKVETENNAVCGDSKEFNVAKNNDDINLQAEDFYVEQNHPVGLRSDGRNNTEVLQQHQQWHIDQRSIDESYSKKGSVFFDFHRLYLAHFNAWKALFGYQPIVEWNPSDPIPAGVEINHTKRNQSAQPSELPPWFKYQPGAEGPENRSIFFVRSFPGQDQLPSGHPLENSGLNITFVGPLPPTHPVAFLNGHTAPMCEEMDYAPNPSGYPISQNALNDFEPNQNLLGCALTNPFHDSNHDELGGEEGDMGTTESSPSDPIFWRFHKFIDNVSVQRFFPPSPMGIASTADRDIASNDSTAPQIISQNPFREPGNLKSLPTISENEKGLFGISGVPAISVLFNEPVIGIKPNDFIVNGSPATQVKGTGLGPFVFIGFKAPETGTVNVTLSKGNITDIAGNKFEGTSWNYTLFKDNLDKDLDGLKDGLEIALWLTDPANPDSDDDTIPDGMETSS